MVEDAAFGDDRVFDLAINQLRAGQEAGARVNRRAGVKEVELRHDRSHIEVGVIERADRTDVFPIIIEEEGLHITLLNRGWNHLATEVLIPFILEHVAQHIELEEIDAHRSEIRPSLGISGAKAEARRVYTHARQLIR